MKRIDWNENGWTVVQEADAVKHILEISCRAENGIIVETRIRHNDGEEYNGSVTKDGANVLPISVKEFKTLYKKGLLTIK